MISLESLSQELLPNIYVKNVTLDNNYKPKVLDNNSKKLGFYDPEANDKILVPDGTGNSKLVLSAKFLKNEGLKSDLALLLDSELNQDFKIFVHQFTDKEVYDSVFAPGGPVVDLNGNITELGKEVLAKNNTSPAGDTITEMRAFSEAILDNNAALYGAIDDSSQGIVLPEEILEDGTILNEIIFEFNFDMPKDTNFLAYAISVGVVVPGANGPNGQPLEYFISNPRREIVILDGLVQDRGLMFTIAPFSSNQGNIQQLQKFGKPGDIWAGPVHFHNGNFMAGASHSNMPHPRLEYSIVPITKFVDNRITEKIEKSLLNVTKAFESLNSLTSRYQGQADFLNFKDYKENTYISEIYLSQDKDKNINGMFFIDKLKILKYNSQFSAMFEIAEQNLTPEQYSAFVDQVLSISELFGIHVYEGNELLGTISNTATESTTENKVTKNSFQMVKQTSLFLPEAISDSLEILSFKHTIASSTASHYDYHVEVEYKDPTVEIVKLFYRKFREISEKLSGMINYINSQNGFQPITQRIKHSVLEQMVDSSTYNVQKNDDGNYIIIDVIPQNDLFATMFYILLYIPDVDISDFNKYFAKFVNLSTVTQDGLLVLQSFLNNMTSKISNSLSAISSVQNKDDSGIFGDYGKEVSNVSAAETNRKKISIKGKANRIKTHEYGYDFTGGMDAPSAFRQQARNTSGFLSISRQALSRMCEELFSDIAKPQAEGEESNITTLYDISYQPGGTSFRSSYLPTQTPRQTMYSYLNISDEVLKYSVMLPPTVMSLQQGIDNFNSSDLFNSKNVLTGIIKLKNYIIENNSFAIFGIQAYDKSLKEDLISILAQGGTSLPSVGQTQLEREIVSAEMTQLEANLVQKDKTISEPTNAGTSFQLDPGFSTANVDFKIDPALNVQGNKFKIDPPYKQTVAKGNLDTTKNNLMNSLMTRKLMTSAGVNMSFNLKKGIAASGYFPSDPDEASGKLPVQIGCLVRQPSAGAQNPFLDFSQDQGYINNYVINPDMLADFWFKHQNLVKIEYLSGFEVYSDVKYIKNKENPHFQGDVITTTERNIKKPMWKLLTTDILTTGFTSDGVLCRLMRYDNADYINRHLVDKLDMPLINSYFIVTN